MVSGGSSSSTSIDLTPPEYEAMRPDVAANLAWLLGTRSAPGTSGNNTFGNTAGWQPVGGGGWELSNANPVGGGWSGARIEDGGMGAAGPAGKVGDGQLGIAGSPIWASLRQDSDYVAGLGEQELAALAQLNQLGSGGAFDETTNEMLNATIRGDYLSPDSNPFLGAYIEAEQRRLREAYNDENLERNALFSRAGHMLPESSPFAEAQARSNESLMNSMGDLATKMAGENYTRERDRQLAASEQGSAINSARFERAAANLEAQALPRLIEQMGIEKGVEEFNWRIEFLMNALGLQASLTTPSIGTESESFEFGIF